MKVSLFDFFLIELNILDMGWSLQSIERQIQKSKVVPILNFFCEDQDQNTLFRIKSAHIHLLHSTGTNITWLDQR